MNLVLLWTDVIVYLLVIWCGFLLYRLVRDKLLLARWRAACARPLRLCAAVVLLIYICIGLLDCVHFRYGADELKVHSVLDVLLQPMSHNQEMSYSSPFAQILLTPNLERDGNDEYILVTKSLQHVDFIKVTNRIAVGMLYGFGILLLISVVLWAVGYRYGVAFWWLRRPWIYGWLCLSCLIVLLSILVQLSYSYHIFGTDKIGTDVFYASLKSIRTALIIGVLTTTITMPFAIILGALAGYWQGWIDDVVQYIYITLSSVPGVLLIAAAMLSLDVVINRNAEVFTLNIQRVDLRLLVLCGVLGLSSWTGLCRIVRAEVLKLRDQDFILAARVLGSSGWQVILRHVVPNLMYIVLLTFVLDFSGLVLAEAVLSYVGVGVDPSMFSWGNMINGARNELARDPVVWWSLGGAFIMMFMLLVAANIFADGVRAVFDPRVHEHAAS